MAAARQANGVLVLGLHLALLGALVGQAACFVPSQLAHGRALFSSLPTASAGRHQRRSPLAVSMAGRQAPSLQHNAVASKHSRVAQAALGANLKNLIVKMAMLTAALFVFIPMQAKAKASAAHHESALLSQGLSNSNGMMGPAEYLVASLQTTENTAAAAFESTMEDETWPGWERTTRKQLLQMKQAHGHDDHAHEARGLVSILLHPIQTVVETLKLMVPLMLITFPICWVFPWELISGNYKDSTKFFRGKANDRPSDKKARDRAIIITSVLNFFLALSFGSGGGGHH